MSRGLHIARLNPHIFVDQGTFSGEKRAELPMFLTVDEAAALHAGHAARFTR